jgi:hypothetical protein
MSMGVAVRAISRKVLGCGVESSVKRGKLQSPVSSKSRSDSKRGLREAPSWCGWRVQEK